MLPKFLMDFLHYPVHKPKPDNKRRRTLLVPAMPRRRDGRLASAYGQGNRDKVFHIDFFTYSCELMA